MEDIVYKMINEDHSGKALAFMRYFVERERNQYSWENCWVAERDGKVVGAVNVYDGAQLYELRQPIVDYLKNNFCRNVIPEDETTSGEYYIDTIGVHPEHRGQGIATNLLKFVIAEYAETQNSTLGLLVDAGSAAERLYLKIGFRNCGRKILLGKSLEHLQLP